MSVISELLDSEIYPAIFEKADKLFPEFEFTKYARGWKSHKYLGGSDHPDRNDKTKITKVAIGRVFENASNASISLWDYVKKRDSLDQHGTLIKLAEMAGVALPNTLSDEDAERIRQNNRAAQIMENANSFFVNCLLNAENPYYKNVNVAKVRGYLTGERLYTPTDVFKMGLGAIPSITDTMRELVGKGDHTEDEIRDAFKFSNQIGDTHILTIPWRDPVGKIKGFIFRTTGMQDPKYLYSSGEWKKDLLFNLKAVKGDKDLVIVEGQLDALYPSAFDIDNVVALGGTSLNDNHVKAAIKAGAKKITLALDNDVAGKKATLNSIDVLKKATIPFYVVEYPEGTKDIEELLRLRGKESYGELVKNAHSWYMYLLMEKLKPYRDRDLAGEELSYKDVDEVLLRITEISVDLEPIERDIFLNQVSEISGFWPLLNGVTADAIKAKATELRYSQDKEKKKNDFQDLLKQSADLVKKGNIEQAIESVQSKLAEIKFSDKATEFGNLLIPINEAELINRLKNKPESIKSGYTIDGEELLIPVGAISVLAAPTSHGKTTFLLNIALNVVQEYPRNSVHVFSYEEDADSILINSLNIFIGKNLSKNNRRSIKSYFSTGSTEFIFADKDDIFIEKKTEFFRELVDTKRLNIHYTNYDSATLIEAIRYLHKHTNVGVVFIDYIQLLNLPDGKYKTYSRQEEIKLICLALKDLSVETGLPIVVGAQFNRQVINLVRIHATQIGEAGDIERIANLIIGFWNTNFPTLEASAGEADIINGKGAHKKSQIYATVLKNRSGKANIEDLFDFNGNTAKITNKPLPADSVDTTDSFGDITNMFNGDQDVNVTGISARKKEKRKSK